MSFIQKGTNTNQDAWAQDGCRADPAPHTARDHSLSSGLYRRLRNRTGSADPCPFWGQSARGLGPKPLPPVGTFTPPWEQPIR